MSGLPDARPVLEGVRVVDLTRLLPGNYATLLLYGLGAEVVKVEELVGDGVRAAPPVTESGESGAHLVLNRGKSSVAINLKDPRGQQVLLRLIASSQVLLDSFRPGVLDRLGLGAEVLAATNPTLVHVSLIAYGGNGPNAALPAHDLNAQALAGILSQSVDDQGRPSMPAVPIADMATGTQAALAVLAGLRGVQLSGTGYRAEVAMADAALSLTALAAGHMAVPGSAPRPRDALTGALACYSVYETADGRWLAVGALEPKFFARMCALIGAEDLAALQYDLGRQDELRGRLAAIFAGATRAHWVELLAGEDTCVTAVNDLREAFAEPNAVEREVIVTAAGRGGEQVPVVRAVPWLPESTPASAAPLGADAEHVLSSVGVSADELASLQQDGIVGGPS